MSDYKKAFEILTHSFKPQFKNKHLMVQDNEQDEYYLSKDEYDCLKDCLNSEPDSMDKTKAFDLILRKAEFKAVVEIEGKRFNIGNKPKEFTNPTLTKEEYECIMKCANAESDTMDRIIEEFKKLGYEVKENKDNYLCLLKDNYIQLEIYNSEYYEYAYKKNLSQWCGMTIEKEEWKLVNRVLRLWGVEV